MAKSRLRINFTDWTVLSAAPLEEGFRLLVLISSTLVVEAYKGLTEAPLPLMADALATKSALLISLNVCLSALPAAFSAFSQDSKNSCESST